MKETTVAIQSFWATNLESAELHLHPCGIAHTPPLVAVPFTLSARFFVTLVRFVFSWADTF